MAGWLVVLVVFSAVVEHLLRVHALVTYMFARPLHERRR